MKTYHNNEEVKADIKNGILNINDDIEIAFDGFSINADIKCHNIYSKGYTRDITANGDINAFDIIANNITAYNITAYNITAYNITAYDITARDISYYAVCYAYKNIKCKSIEGRRCGNFKHFCLDGDITIVKDEPIEVIEELTMEEVCKRLGKTIKIKK